MMKVHSLIIASTFAIGLAMPAMAQQSMHRYLSFFKYADNAVKAMTENPQDRSAQGAKLAESFGGKVIATYYIPSGSEFDGVVILELPDDVTAEAQGLFVRATGNFTKIQSMPLMTADEFKAAMEKAKSVKTGYTPPTSTKQ
jgi:uncharacterized protein with GYD domain